VTPVFSGLTRLCQRASWRVTDCPGYAVTQAVKCRQGEARLGNIDACAAWFLLGQDQLVPVHATVVSDKGVQRAKTGPCDAILRVDKPIAP